MDESNPWKVKSSKVVYKNRWIEVVEDKVITPEGKDGIYAYIKTNDSVVVIALNDNNEVFLTKNFRYPTSQWKWILPGGGGNKEHLLEASKRELKEETGITAKSWVKLGETNVCDGLMTETMATYLARDLTIGKKPFEPDEPILDKKFFSLEEIDSMIDSGEIDDGQAITSLYLLKRRLIRFLD